MTNALEMGHSRSKCQALQSAFQQEQEHDQGQEKAGFFDEP